MKSITGIYIRTIDRMNKFFGYALAFIMAFMTIIIFWQVIARYVVGSSLAWSEELSRFLMILMIMIGSSLALRENQLISVEIVPEAIRGRAKKWLTVLVHLISIVFYIVIIAFGWKVAQSFGNQIAPGTGISMFFIYLSLPLGGVLLLLNSITCILEQFIERKE
ncbi:TRAP transporter small permease [Cytobacillus firmus]|uniref:TRAP transporter small permease n=1 Tax=Cytobacillus firmus TaxID=1399 RepID=UPI001C8DD37C|nr:TRAP transporter small permease [Cytobacillus firmus]MBX9974487.1 TRAP transporter small permease [Cytobacillus firmus]